MLSKLVIADIVPHCLVLLIEDQRFESALFWKFIRDYLIHDETDMVQVTIAIIWEVIHGLLNGIFTSNLGSL